MLPTNDDDYTTRGAADMGWSTGNSMNGSMQATKLAQFDLQDALADELLGERAVLQTTREDARDMRRMGKQQELVRHFRLLSVTSFVALATASWELGIFLITPALLDGGRSGLLYSYMWTFLGFGPVYLSMAEMASMAPIAGAQYHWVSEFAPESCQQLLSYLTGWICTLAWQAGNGLGVFLVGTLIQVIISILNPEYSHPAWHTTLFAVGAVIMAYIVNVYGNGTLPLWQNAVFAIHIMMFFAMVIPIWCNAPKATSLQVWADFTNTGGWSSLPLAVMIGQLSSVSNCIGIDTAAHMAEEVKNAARAVPRAMIGIYLINFLLLFPSIVSLCYGLPDLEAAMHDQSRYPAVYVFRQSMSSSWVVALLVAITTLLAVCNVVWLTAVTRDLWAFARDKGLPFSKWIAKIDRAQHVPKNAAILTSILSSVLGLIYLGSSVAFYAITSLYTVAMLQCYAASIGCCLWRRIARPETMPTAEFSLGRWGVPINSAAIAYTSWAFFWSFWPTTSPVQPSNFNWAPVIFVATMIIALIFYYIRGRYQYFGPVHEIEGRKLSYTR